MSTTRSAGLTVAPSTDPPAELRDLKQWVVWRYETRRGEDKPTKVLYQAERLSEKAKSTDPSTWSTYDVAVGKVAAANEHPRVKDVDGIGFVFSEDDPYVGIDIDHAVVDGAVHPAAQAVIDELNSYSELSPSGTACTSTRAVSCRPTAAAAAPASGRRHRGL